VLFFISIASQNLSFFGSLSSHLYVHYATSKMISASSESQAAQVTVLDPEETQDSQALYEAYKIELGVGTVCP
jgi:hypothetical protein